MPLSGQFHKNERMCFISCCLFLAVCYRFEDVIQLYCIRKAREIFRHFLKHCTETTAETLFA